MFGNPIEKGPSRAQILALILYLIFLSASVWATAESLARTTKLPPAFCYIIAAAFLTGASFCLALIKRSHGDGYVSSRGLKGFVGILGFLFLWVVSLTSNTHNFYFVATSDELRREELGAVYSGLQSLDDLSDLAVQSAKEKLRTQIEAKIEQMKQEILNPGDPGPGPVTESVVNEIENVLQREVQVLDPPSRSLSGYRTYADAMANQIRRLLETRLSEIDESYDSVRRYLGNPRFTRTTSDLESVLDSGLHQIDPRTLRELLIKAFELYGEAVAFLQQAFSSSDASQYVPDLAPLPNVPRSVELENIATSWKDFLSGKYQPWKFWLSLLWAVALDAAAFIVFYFGVLPKDDY